MAATAGYEWSQPPLLPQSPDATSPSSTDLAAEYSSVYPGRPIRPLPRRRIRARLSVEQAEAIIYPPNTSTSLPLFVSSLSSGDRALHQAYYSGEFDATSQDDHDQDHDHDHDHIHEHTCGCTCDRSDLDSEEEEEEEEETTKAPAHRYSWPGRMMRLPRQYLDRVTNRSKPPAPNSTTSSADGYESFENTNNKKKRKIPVSSAAVSGFRDSAAVGAQALDGAVSDGRREYPEQYYQAGASGVGITGAGRGRYGKNNGRIVSERRPLAPSTNASNTNASASRRDHNSDLGWLNLPTSGKGEVNFLPAASKDQGIISSAIANAAVKGPMRTPKGQENISLLQRMKEGAPQPQSFTFESEPKLKMSSHPTVSARSGSTQPGQYQPTQSTNGGHSNVPLAQPLAGNETQGAPHTERERTESEIRADQNREYKKAARNRKTAQQAKNRAAGPKLEDEWICHFCEYEAIFGVPPRALIREYEVKDARARRDTAEKKRLLEKAKAKGRKLKKGARAARNSAAPSGHHADQSQFYDDQYDPADPQDHDSQAGEVFDDGIDEDLPPTPYPNPGIPSAQFSFPPESVTMTKGPPNGPAG